MKFGKPVRARFAARGRRPGRGVARGGALRVWAGGLLCAVACGAGPSASPEEPRPAAVEVMKLQPEELHNVVEIPGQLESDQSVWVRSEIEGVIASIEFEEGQEVQQGDVLFRLRDHEQRARLREATANLALAEEVHRRTQELARRDVSSAAQLDRAAAELGVGRARVELAKVQLERTQIRAPFAGVVGARRVSIGERVQEEMPLVQLDAIDRLQLVFSLPEVAVGVVRTGVPVRVRVAPYPQEVFEGEVFFVSPTLDPEGRRIVLKAWIPNPDRRLRPGLFASIEAEIERHEAALIVPESSVVYDLDGIHVWRVGEDDRAERVAVELGLHLDGRVEVREGLRPGDVVVTAGTHKLQAGARLAPTETTRAAGVAEPRRGS